MEEQQPTQVIYRSGTNENLGPGWDVMHVVYQQGGHVTNSVVLARDSRGTIIRRTDVLLDRWEQITDDESLKTSRQCFDNRDRLAAEQAAGAGVVTESTDV
jgi:hypothetical protein